MTNEVLLPYLERNKQLCIKQRSKKSCERQESHIHKESGKIPPERLENTRHLPRKDFLNQMGNGSRSPSAAADQLLEQSLTRLKTKAMKRLLVVTKRDNHTTTHTSKGIACPVCVGREFRTIDLARAHMRVNHQSPNVVFTEMPENTDGIVGRMVIDYTTKRKYQAKERLEKDHLPPGEERCLVQGRTWIRRHAQSRPSGVLQGISFPPAKRRRIAVDQNEPFRDTVSTRPGASVVRHNSIVGTGNAQTMRVSSASSPSNSPRTATCDKQVLKKIRSKNDHSKIGAPSQSGSAIANLPTSQRFERQGEEVHETKVLPALTTMEKARDLLDRLDQESLETSISSQHKDSRIKLRRHLDFVQELQNFSMKHEEHLLGVLEQLANPAHNHSLSTTRLVSEMYADASKQLGQIQERWWAQKDDVQLNSLEGQNVDHRMPLRESPRLTLENMQDSVSGLEAQVSDEERTPADRTRLKYKLASASCASTEDNANVLQKKLSQGASQQETPKASQQQDHAPLKSSSTRSLRRLSDNPNQSSISDPIDRADSSLRVTRSSERPSRGSSIENIDPVRSKSMTPMELRSSRPRTDRADMSKLWVTKVQSLPARTVDAQGEDKLPTSIKMSRSASEQKSSQQSTTMDDTASTPPAVNPLPVYQKKKYRVPKARVGVRFFTSVTKRPLDTDEELSESDDDGGDDGDGAWLALKQDQLIDRLPNAPPEAKEFMKAWNAHFRRENVPGDRFFADAFMRFTAANLDFLRRFDINPEFKKKMAELKVEGLIRQGHISKSNEMVNEKPASYRKGSKRDLVNYWSVRCLCGKDVIDVGEAVICSGKRCINPDYHLKCVGLTSAPKQWLCSTCAPRT